MKIAFFDIQGWEKPTIKKLFKDHEVHFHKESLTPDTVQLASDADIISVFIYSCLTEEVLKALPKLKLVVTRSTGFDHIHGPTAKKLGLTVCNVPFYGENTVAEHTFALILSLSRNIHKSYVRTLRNDFSIDGLKGFDLKGKTLGVIGAGHIGLHVIRMAKGFGMKVCAFDMYPNNFIAEVLDYQYCSIEEVLKNADIISLHVPYNKHTHHLINRETIATMKKGAVLINTARGGVVDTDALLEALESGHIAGAGLDVLEGEEAIRDEKRFLASGTGNKEQLSDLLRDHLIMQMENVVYTPHIAFYSQEALDRILETSCENIVNYLAKEPSHVVDF